MKNEKRKEKSHTSEEGGAHLRIHTSFRYLLKNLKNKYLLKNYAHEFLFGIY